MDGTILAVRRKALEHVETLKEHPGFRGKGIEIALIHNHGKAAIVVAVSRECGDRTTDILQLLSLPAAVPIRSLVGPEWPPVPRGLSTSSKRPFPSAQLSAASTLCGKPGEPVTAAGTRGRCQAMAAKVRFEEKNCSPPIAAPGASRLSVFCGKLRMKGSERMRQASPSRKL